MDLIRHLRYFVAVAEQRNFGRAAEQLGVTQPPVSQGVRRIEESFGVRLFERAPTGVTLTAHGADLLPRARLLLDDAERLFEEAARLSGPPRQLRLGFCGAIDDRLLSACVLAVRESVSDTSLPVLASSAGTADLLDDIRHQRLDVAIVEHPALLDGLPATAVVRIPRWVLLPAEHRAARMAAPRIVALADLDFATSPREHNPPGQDLLIDEFRLRGLDPSVVAAPQPRDVISAVLSGRCFGLTTAATLDLPGIAQRRLIPRETDLKVRVVAADPHRFQRPIDLLDRTLRRAHI